MASFQLTLSEDNYEGGHDYEFVIGPPSDEYTCLICTLVVRNAQQASCCGKLFCRQCLENSVRVNDNCPNCREDLNGKYFPDRRAIRVINQLKVYCKNKDKGCTWEGEVRHAKNHCDRCPYRHVQCPNQCNEAVRSMDLPKHLETQCPKREVRCRHCKQIGDYAYISMDHLEDCPDLQIECPNEGCRVKQKRKNMEIHRQLCPKETVSCEYANFGCNHVCPREDITDHNQTQMQIHLQLATSELRTVRTLLESRTGAPKGHVFKMTNFSKLKEKGEKWCSPPFYAFPGGYKMCLRVHPGGNGDGKGTHISAFLYLMAGENDEILEWPMRGIFSIELLNQIQDGNHKMCSVAFCETNANEQNSKVSKGRAPNGWGRPKFVEHKDIEDNVALPGLIPRIPLLRTQYLTDDILYFRVTMTEQMSKSKPWLAGAIPS